jgi:hypothetical protein
VIRERYERPARLARPPRRTRINDLDALVEPYRGAIILGLVVTVAILLIAVLSLARRTSRLKGRLDRLTRGEEGDSIEDVIDAHLDRVQALGRGMDDLAARTRALEAASLRAFQQVGLVRYNPFEDTGGNQSFALALLDAKGDGWVLSSLHSRTGTRVYAKAISQGRSEGALSAEESAAIRQATA